MNKRHYYIAVKNQFDAPCTVYEGTNLPKMAKAYSELQDVLAPHIEVILDIDENYDPDLGAFPTVSQLFDGEALRPWMERLLPAADRTLERIRERYGNTAE